MGVVEAVYAWADCASELDALSSGVDAVATAEGAGADNVVPEDSLYCPKRGSASSSSSGGRGGPSFLKGGGWRGK